MTRRLEVGPRLPDLTRNAIVPRPTLELLRRKERGHDLYLAVGRELRGRTADIERRYAAARPDYWRGWADCLAEGDIILRRLMREERRN